jgi:molybdopterin-guanine dinucleotide biosynthesis protein A/ribonucleotide monophosphatase NagD (HAD superfamily)
MKFNVIIPMAGEGSRFGYVFKPFIKIDDRTFIEHVLDSFTCYDDSIDYYYFIVTKEQDNTYRVTDTLKLLFPDIITKIKVLCLDNKTAGPYQTVINALGSNHIKDVFICDCDHKITIQPMIECLTSVPNADKPDILIPIWEIAESEHPSWGKVVTRDNGNICNFCEKETIKCEENEKIYGMIGCYYFKSTSVLERATLHVNMSDFFKTSLTLNITTCKIDQAFFFGTPEQVNKYVDLRRNHENIICDIDGVLFKHSPNSNTTDEGNILIQNCKNKILHWKAQNKKIILMTARSKTTKSELVKLLNLKGIYYDDLIMGANPGTRYVINDIKPSHIFTKQAVALNVIRDHGIDDIICNELSNNSIKIVKVLKGGSFSSNYLLEQNGKRFVRKYIIKTEETMEHYNRLKRQCDDLKRFHYYSENLVPKIITEQDTSYDYFYDMVFFENYEQLDCFTSDIHHKAVGNIMDKLRIHVYCYKKQLNHDEQTKFMDDYLKEKIYCKLDKFEKDCETMNYLINATEISINGRKYYGLREALRRANVYKYTPTFICPIHGDLNFENILYNESKDDVITIDMEGSRYVDTPLFDLGKLFQSVVSKYEVWSKLENVTKNDDINDLRCIDDYFDFDKNDTKFVVDIFNEIFQTDDDEFTINAGIFYMANYFIRFIPFRMKVSKNHGIFAMIMSIVWLNKII